MIISIHNIMQDLILTIIFGGLMKFSMENQICYHKNFHETTKLKEFLKIKALQTNLVYLKQLGLYQ